MKIQQRLLLIVTFAISLFLIITSSSFAYNTNPPSSSMLSNPSPEFVLDQMQEEHSHISNIHSIVWMAQSFKPSMSPLTKVELKLEKLTEIYAPLELSIRKNLTSNDLTYAQLPADQIPYFSHWVEIDIPDIEVTVDDTYYIIVRTQSPSGHSYSWYDMYAEDQDYYHRGEQWFSNDLGATWSKTSSFNFNIDFTFRTYSFESYTDLTASGSFNWTEIKPGQTVNGSFTLRNEGTPLSNLDWKIYNWPSWGTWTFSPSSGTNLKPENGPLTIRVSVEAPHTNVPDTYTGKILIINENNEEDYEYIDATMETPHKKQILTHPFLEYLKDNHVFLWNILTQTMLDK